MVKHLSTLAHRVVQTQQTLSSVITRIQHGFLPIENTHEAQRQVAKLTQLVKEIEEVVRVAKPVYYQDQKILQ
jgi:hypothetical protein